MTAAIWSKICYSRASPATSAMRWPDRARLVTANDAIVSATAGSPAMMPASPQQWGGLAQRNPHPALRWRATPSANPPCG
jgi:hypothetical protein